MPSANKKKKTIVHVYGKLNGLNNLNEQYSQRRIIKGLN
jgi:hypothetical protein